jgi:hypothetical protein
VPAAYPRTFKRSVGRNSRESTPFGVGPKGESKEDRQLRNAKQAQSVLEARFSCEDGPDSTGDPGQWISAERWKKDDSEDGLVLVLTHGTGFNKEVSVAAALSNGITETDSLHSAGTLQ